MDRKQLDDLIAISSPDGDPAKQFLFYARLDFRAFSWFRTYACFTDGNGNLHRHRFVGKGSPLSKNRVTIASANVIECSAIAAVPLVHTGGLLVRHRVGDETVIETLYSDSPPPLWMWRFNRQPVGKVEPFSANLIRKVSLWYLLRLAISLVVFAPLYVVAYKAFTGAMSMENAYYIFLVGVLAWWIFHGLVLVPLYRHWASFASPD